MKTAKRILSLIMTGIMVFSMFTIGFTVNAVDVASSSVFTEIPTTPGERPKVQFTCTDVTYAAKAVNSTEPGTTIVKATPSGVPELSGAYASQAYAGETPAATKITFTASTVGITPVSLKCNNSTVVFSDMTYDGATGTYSCEIVSGTAVRYEDGTYEPLVFTMDYKWTDGNDYQEKCVSYVEGIKTGGVFTYIECTFRPYSGTNSYYRTSVSAITRLLGKGVYYEQPATIVTSTSNPYRTYGVYNAATATYLSNVASGYNTLIYENDKTVDANGATKNIYFDNFIPGAPTAHVYVDSSTATTLADINLRIDANTQRLTDRNNSNPYTAISNMYVYEGLQTTGLAGSSNKTAEATIGYNVPAKANYGVKQQYENAAMTTITGGAKAYNKIITKGFTGEIANIADGSEYTVTHEYYSYNYVKDAVLIEGNLTTIARVATPIVFHVVDKGALRELLEYVMTSDPDTPILRNPKKGTNPQAWYYSSGFANFQTAYEKALKVANNSKASQTEIDAATKSLQSAYNSLQLKTADYTEVNELKATADEIVANAYAYPAEDVALVEEALTYYAKNYNILYQNAVDVMADNLRIAIRNAKPYPADYQEVYAAKIAFESLDETMYTKASWQAVEDVIAGVDFGLTILDQDIVDGYAQSILDATAALEIQTAEFDELVATVEEAEAIDGNIYANFDILTEPLQTAKDAIEDDLINIWPKERQSEVDEMNSTLRNAIDSLVLKDIDKSALKAAIDAKLHRNESYYDQALLASYKALVAEGQTVYDDETLATILEQGTVDAKTEELTTAYEALQASYNPPVDISALEEALDKADEIIAEHYVEDDALTEFLAAKAAGEEIISSDLTAESAQTVADAATRILNAIDSITLKDADTEVLKDLVFDLVSMDYEEITVVTYIDGVFGEEKAEKYNDSDLRALITSINTFLNQELTIKDNDRINAFADEIEEKINNLETYSTTEYLDVAKAEYENSNSEYCTEEEWALYTEAYNAATLSEDAGQAEINTALTNLVNAKPEFEVITVDTTELEEVLAEAKALELDKYDSNDAMAELLEAISEAEEILATPLEDTAENREIVDSSIIRLTVAMENLDLVDDPAVLYDVLNNAMVKLDETVEVVTYIDGVLGTEEKAKYDSDAVQAIIDEVTEVLASIEKGDATIDIVGWINDYAEEQQAKLDALTALTYPEYLAVATAEYEAVTDSSIYTQATWANYKAAYNDATGLVDANQAEINTALTNLVNAKNALRENTSTAYIEAAEGTETVVDKENGIIYGLSADGLYDLEGYVEYAGGTLEYVETSAGFGTGTVVNLMVDGEVYESYTIVIFGDITGDGVIDTYDSSKLAAIVNGDVEVEEGTAIALAADITDYGVIDTYDLSKLNAVVNGDTEISQTPEI